MSNTACTIKPFQQYDEHDVINLYSFSGVLPVSKGTFVKVITGWLPNQELTLLGSPGASFTNTVSSLYGNPAQVGQVTDSGAAVLGMLLYDVKLTDENGEAYKFNPRKAAENEVAITGNSVPIVDKGIFLYSGVKGSPTAGAAAYVDNDALLWVTGNGSTRVGTFLGPAQAGVVLFRLHID
mgnify:CR=1 FL=1